MSNECSGTSQHKTDKDEDLQCGNNYDYSKQNRDINSDYETDMAPKELNNSILSVSEPGEEQPILLEYVCKKCKGDMKLNLDSEHDKSKICFCKVDQDNCQNYNQNEFLPESTTNLNEREDNSANPTNSTEKYDEDDDSFSNYFNYFRTLSSFSTVALINSLDIEKVNEHLDALSSNSINQLKESLELRNILQTAKAEDRISIILNYFSKKSKQTTDKNQVDVSAYPDNYKESESTCVERIVEQQNVMDVERVSKCVEFASGLNSTGELKLDSNGQSSNVDSDNESEDISTMIDNDVFHEYAIKIFDISDKSLPSYSHNIRQMCLLLNSEANFMEDVLGNSEADDNIKKFFFIKSLNNIKNIISTFSCKWSIE